MVTAILSFIVGVLVGAVGLAAVSIVWGKRNSDDDSVF